MIDQNLRPLLLVLCSVNVLVTLPLFTAFITLYRFMSTDQEFQYRLWVQITVTMALATIFSFLLIFWIFYQNNRILTIMLYAIYDSIFLLMLNWHYKYCWQLYKTSIEIQSFINQELIPKNIQNRLTLLGKLNDATYIAILIVFVCSFVPAAIFDKLHTAQLIWELGGWCMIAYQLIYLLTALWRFKSVIDDNQSLKKTYKIIKMHALVFISFQIFAGIAIISLFFSNQTFGISMIFLCWMSNYSVQFLFYKLLKKFNQYNIDRSNPSQQMSMLKLLQARKTIDTQLSSKTTRLEAIRNWNEIIKSQQISESQASFVDKESYYEAEQLVRVFCELAGEDQMKLLISIPENYSNSFISDVNYDDTTENDGEL